MPCDTKLKKDETLEQRSARADAATERLEKALTAGRVRVQIGPNGAAAFVGWAEEDRDGVADVCAIRRLTKKNSWPFRQAIVKAEAASGRRFNMQAVNAGLHSHDGGKTWGTH